MEKISKVVPASNKNRIDMSKERPVRSGVPTFGMPVALSAAKENQLAEEARRSQELSQLKAKASSEMSRPLEIIDRVNINFSGKTEKPDQLENEPSTLIPENSIDNISDSIAPEERKSLSLYA